jgi:hypothetical protein
MNKKLIFIGFCIVLMALPVMAEQPWDSNATYKRVLNITTTTDSLDENYTFKLFINGSDLDLEADCSDLFIVYQDTVEGDRIYEGNCQTAEQDGLNVSWKMRPGATVSSSTTNQDWSIWTDGIDGIVPSDNKFLVYTLYDDFSDGSLNSTKWDGGGVEANGVLDCGGGRWENPTRTATTFGGSWQVDFSLNSSNRGTNTGDIGWCNAFASGGSVCTATTAKDLFAKGGSSVSYIMEYYQGTTLLTSSTAYTKDVYANATIKRVITGTGNGEWSWFNYNSGQVYTGTPTNYGNPRFICGQADGQTNAIMLDEVAIHKAVEFEPSYTLNDAGISRSLYQISPQQSSAQTGYNTNFSCLGEIESLTGTNITNITFRIYDPADALEDYTIFDLEADEVNESSVSYLYNLTTDGTWKYACDMTDTDDTITSTINTSFTVDTGIPTITLTAPILESNISNIFSIYSVLDATSISCDYSINAGANTSIACTNDGVETTTELDLSAIINYGVLNQFYFYANDSLANNNSKVINFTVVERIAENYPSEVLETDVMPFNITVDDALGILNSATLKYNNLNYVGVLLGTSGTQKTYGATIPAPTVSGVETKYFNWSIAGTISTKAGSTTYPTNSHSVGNIEIVPTTDGSTCEGGSATLYTLNFTFKDESSQNLIDGLNVTQYYNVWTDSSSNSLNFTWVESHNGISSYPVCIFPDYAEIYANVKLIYGDEGNYGYREFNLQNHQLTNTTQHYTIYAVNDSLTTTITMNLVDENNFELQGYVINAILVDYGNITNLEYQVEAEVTDLNGQVLFELDTSKYYKFEVWKEGILVQTIEPPFILKQTEYTISISLEDILSLTVMLGLNDLENSLTYDEITQNITATWADNDGLSSQICLRISQINSMSALNNECSNDSNGVIIYHVPNVNDTYYVAQIIATTTADENSYVINLLDLDFYDAYQKFGVSGLFWGGVILIGSLMVMGIFNPAVAIGVSLFGLIIMGHFLKIFVIGWGALVGIIVIGLFLVVRLKS